MMFMRLRLSQPNFLILDEPTNHIDLEGKEQLEDELISSAATLLITSHDREFINRLATRWLWIDQRRLRELTSPTPFYQSLSRPQTRVAPAVQSASAILISPSMAVPLQPDLDALLARIDLLEGLLHADLARKPRFQKPAKQRQWQTEIDQLWRQLGA
jgi:ABC-type multidrug transport system ATPase subunit